MKRLALSLLVAFSSATWAHGDSPQAAKAVDYSKAEQTAYGIAADPRKAKKTVRLEMTDQMRFLPSEITVKQGEIVRLVAVNKGTILHEMVLGTMTELKEHAELMKKHAGMEHDEPYMVHVAPGRKAELVWRFTKAGEFHYGCLVPGHLEAGMTGKVIVRP